MDELNRLLAARVTGEARSRTSALERGIIVVAGCGVFAVACAFAVVGFLCLAVFFAALPDYGEIKAACFAALAAAVVMGVILFSIRRFLQPDTQPAERPSPLAGAAQAAPPKTIWDLVALVVAGVVAGLSQKR